VSDLDKLKAWTEAVERVALASKAQLAGMKLFQAGGPDAQAAWDAIEKSRAAFVAACRREQARWKSVVGIEVDQQEMDGKGFERPGPRKPEGGSGAKEVRGAKEIKALPARGGDASG
jgi:hypothetical protein